MQVFVATLAILLAVFAALSLGALLGRAPLRRGCAGLAECEACPRRCERRAVESGE